MIKKPGGQRPWRFASCVYARQCDETVVVAGLGSVHIRIPNYLFRARISAQAGKEGGDDQRYLGDGTLKSQRDSFKKYRGLG